MNSRVRKDRGFSPGKFSMPLAGQDVRTFFITSVTAQRRRLFQVTTNCELLIDVLRENTLKSRFDLHAFVVMPDHFHLLLTPAPDVSLEKAVQYVKGGFSFRLKSKGDVWEKSFMEHRIKDRVDYRNHREYIEQNPVRKRMSESAHEHPYSSANYFPWLKLVPAHLASAGAEAPVSRLAGSQG